MLDVVAHVETDSIAGSVVGDGRLIGSQGDVLADAPRTERMRSEREKEREHHVRRRAESCDDRQARDGDNAGGLIGDEPTVARGSITGPSVEYEATEAKGENLSPRGIPRPQDFFQGRCLRVATVRLASVTQIPMV